MKIMTKRNYIDFKNNICYNSMSNIFLCFVKLNKSNSREGFIALLLIFMEKYVIIDMPI